MSSTASLNVLTLSLTNRMGEAFGSFLFGAYSLAGQVLRPLIPSILDRRAQRGLEDKSRRDERLGIASSVRPDRSVIWVHAASVGETNAVLPLVGELTASGWYVVLTTITTTGAATAVRLQPADTLHQFAPVDIRSCVGRFLDHWRPSLALFAESEVWPVVADQLSRRDIPHIIVNAHMSERSFRRWRLLGTATRRVFGRVGLVLAQSDVDAARLERLGARRTIVVGNLKFDVPPPVADAEKLMAFEAAVGDRPFLLAASTHAGEEEIVAAAHVALARRHPRLTTAIVPRHPDRGPSIADAIAPLGVDVSRRAAGEEPPRNGGIYIADTLGELGVFYRVADIAFVGGSLVPLGGHNPVEPVVLGSAVIHGPHTQNFSAIYRALLSSKGSVSVATADHLVEAIAHLRGDPGALRRQTEAAERTLEGFTGALHRTLDALQPLLPRSAISSR